MSLVSKLKNRELGGAGTGERSPMENLAVKVTSYEDDRVIGVRLDTGEPVRVALRQLDAETKAALRKDRPEIADFVADKGYYDRKLSVCDNDKERAETLAGIKNKTEPGGVILFDACFLDKKTGEISSRWATCLSRYEDGAHVLPKALARVNKTYAKEGQNGEPTTYNATVTVLDIDSSIKVANGAGLQKALADAFAANGILNGAGVMVRVQEGESVIVMEQMLGNHKVEGVTNEAGYQEYAFNAPSDSADYFMKSENGQALAGWDGQGAVVEVIPTLTLRMGQATKAAILAKDSTYTDRTTQEVKTVTGDQRLRNNGKRFTLPNGTRGFTECAISFFDPKGTSSPVFGTIEPATTKPTFVPASGIKTANIQPTGAAIEAMSKVEDGAIEHAGGVDGNGIDLEEFGDTPAAAKRSSGPGL